MAGKDHKLKWSTTAASNTDIANIGIQGTNLVSGFDNAIREYMKEEADAITRHVVKAAGSYTPALTDHNQFWRCTGAVTLTLTAAATLTDGWCLWIRANGGAVTIDPNGAELIDGAATLILADGEQALIICTGTAFFLEFRAGRIAGKGADKASAGTTDLSTVGGNYVHITGTTTITALGTDTAGRIVTLEFDGALTFTHNATSLILPSALDITTAAGDVAVMVSEGSGNWRCVSYQPALSRPPYITPWVSYTPTFTGFGTASSITVWSRRIGDTLHIRGRFTTGTSTAVEARVTLGFNGVNGGLAIDGTKVSGVVNQVGGTVTRSTAAAASAYCLLQGAVGYITFGTQSAGTASQTSVNGSSLLPTIGDIASFMCEVPISGW